MIKEAAVFPNDAGKQASGNNAGAFTDLTEGRKKVKGTKSKGKRTAD